MSDPRSVVTFEARGKTHKFILGTYALVMLERRTKMKASQFFNRKDDEQWGVEDTLNVFFCGLQRYHGEMTETDASDIIDELGVDRVTALIFEALGVARPEAAEGDENPPVAKANVVGMRP